MITLTCEPVTWQKKASFENVIIRDSDGFPWVLAYTDMFWEKDSEVSDKIQDNIKNGISFEIGITLIP